MVKNVTVYLDTDQLEFMDRVRCGFIVAEDGLGQESFHHDLIDSAEYCSIKELIDDIVGLFGIHRQAVMVAS